MKIKKNYLKITYSYVTLFLFILIILVNVSCLAQDMIFVNFDWLSDFCEKNGIQISYYKLFLVNGLGEMAYFPIFTSTIDNNFLYTDPFINIYPVYGIINSSSICGYNYKIELGDISISKKIIINDNLIYYPGICFNFNYTSTILTNKDMETEYFTFFKKIPYEISIKIGTSQSLEYNINKIILKLTANIYYSYYELESFGPINDFQIKGHYIIFQFFILAGFKIRKNIKLFSGLESYSSTNYLIKDAYCNDPNFYLSAPIGYPYEMLYNILENINIVIFLSFG